MDSFRHPLIKHCATPYNSELKNYFEERHQRAFRRNTIGSRQKLAYNQRYWCPLCTQSFTDFTEKLVAQLKVPEKYGGHYSYKNLELVHYRCGQFWEKWKNRFGDMPDVNNRRNCEKELRQLRLSGIV